MTIHECLAILRARWKTIVLTLAATVGLAVMLSIAIPPHYKGAAMVVVDVKAANPVADAVLPSQLIANYIQTQVDIINSDPVARDVVARLQLERRPEILEYWHSSFYYDPANFESWAVDWLRKKLSVKPPPSSNVITINFTSKDPQFAAEVANAFAAAYLKLSLELNIVPARNFAQWFQERIGALRESLEAAQQRLSVFQRSHGIVALDEHLDLENARLAELTAELASAQGIHADGMSRQSESATDIENLPEVLQNPLVTTLKTNVAFKESELEQVAARLGDRHPQYISLKSELNSLKAREAREVRRVASSLNTTVRIGRHRVADMERLVEAQKERVLQLRSERDQAGVLQRDVETARRAYELATERLAQSSLQGQMQQTNVALLAKAVPPIIPSWPKLSIDVALAMFLGGLLGFGIALLRESADPVVRNSEQLGQLAGIPVLAMIRSRPHRAFLSARGLLSSRRRRVTARLAAK